MILDELPNFGISSKLAHKNGNAKSFHISESGLHIFIHWFDRRALEMIA